METTVYDKQGIFFDTLFNQGRVYFVEMVDGKINSLYETYINTCKVYQ